MSDLHSPASDRAPIADTPARSDHALIADTPARASVSTNVMVALDSDDDPITSFGHMPMLSLLTHCLHQIGSARWTNDPSDPAHEMALRVLIVMLKDNSFSADHPLIPRRRHHALLTAAQTALDQCEAR